MRRIPSLLTALVFVLLTLTSVRNISSQPVPDPEKYFGFRPGSDGQLIGYDSLISYLEKLDDASAKVSMAEIGHSPMGRKLYAVFISSEGNLANLENLRRINRELALNDKLGENERNKMLKEGRVFLMATLSMHSTEVGPAQAFPLTAFRLATSSDPSVLKILNNVVFVVISTHNPDGMDMVVTNYNKNKGTIYEKSSFPGLYHKYLGHDNNRDFISLTQEDSRAVSRFYSTEWYPQVLVDKHQMGMTGPRYFVPPYHDPLSENIDPEFWNWIGVFGASLIKDMTKEGCAGVSTHTGFDNYWPGSTKTSLWKNIITFLTECAGAYTATPAYIEPSELSVGGKGLSEYKISTNMPMPWPGGWWRLGDIVRFEISSSFSMLSTAANNREEILRFRNDMCRRQVYLGTTSAPFYYILPANQHDPSELVHLIRLLQEHGISVFRLKEQQLYENRIIQAGDFVIPMSQPYRALIKEILEKQYYPERHYTPGGELIKPYDITSWSLPLHWGVDCYAVNSQCSAIGSSLEAVDPFYKPQTVASGKSGMAVFPANSNESYRIAFSAIEKKMKVLRTLRDGEAEKHSIPAGSFLIGHSPELTGLLEDCAVAPVWLSGTPDIASEEVKLPRIGLIETWFQDIDAGWTRRLLDTYHLSFTLLRPGDIRNTDLTSDFDLLIFPDNSKTVLMDGKFRREDNSSVLPDYAPQYTKGIGTDGWNKILTFLTNGGHIISWGESTNLFTGTLSLKNENGETGEFRLPFTNQGESLSKSGLYSPGSLVRIGLIRSHPLTYGMEPEANVFYRGRGAFSTSPPYFDTDRKVIGTFPEREILRSGYAEKVELLAGKPAMIMVSKGEGKLVLMAFSPAFRASTPGVYKLLFNSVLLE